MKECPINIVPNFKLKGRSSHAQSMSKYATLEIPHDINPQFVDYESIIPSYDLIPSSSLTNHIQRISFIKSSARTKPQST
jgi:hypothetical protein